jgi:hypothetical protein
MKILFTILAVISIAMIASCDAQSGIAKKSVEDYQPTPTPSISPAPTEAPVDPVDVITVDTNLEGEKLTVDGPNEKKTVECTKFNRLTVNSNDNVVTIKGACKQLMINGNRNDVTAEAIVDIVVNGSENNVKYSKYANGKRPIVKENRSGNIIEKIAAPTAK